MELGNNSFGWWLLFFYAQEETTTSLGGAHGKRPYLWVFEQLELPGFLMVN